MQDGRNLADLIRNSAQAAPNKVALLSNGGSLTWRQLDEAVDRAAAALRGLGLQPGDRVALVLGNTLDFPVAYFGVLRAGFVALPVNTAYTPPELASILGDSGARAAVVGQPFADKVNVARQDLEALEHVLVAGGTAPAGTTPFAELVGRQAAEPGPAVGGGEDLAVLLYTSGTSGRPKGAMLSHRALLADLDNVSRIEPPVLTPDDVSLIVLPLFHVFGLNTGLGLTMQACATGVLVERFDPVQTLADIRRYGVTNVVGVPPMYVAWSLVPDVGEAFSGVRLAVSGAAPLSADVQRRLLDATGRHVFEGYGLTETSPTVTSSLMSEVPKAGSVGRPVPGVEVQLVDSSGQEVDEDDPGEVRVRGANLFSGYWPDGRDGPDDDGWWCTGDVAVADADGDLHLVDRQRELIIVNGFNVYPAEVENVLLKHPDVAEAAVLGVPHPYTGESVKAYVVRRPGANPTTEELLEHAARSLARFKCPTAVEFVDDLPHTAIGKVAKSRLREIIGEARGTDVVAEPA